MGIMLAQRWWDWSGRATNSAAQHFFWAAFRNELSQLTTDQLSELSWGSLFSKVRQAKTPATPAVVGVLKNTSS